MLRGRSRDSFGWEILSSNGFPSSKLFRPTKDIDYVRTSYAILYTLIPLIVGSSLQRMTEEKGPRDVIRSIYSFCQRGAMHPHVRRSNPGRKFSNCAGRGRVPYCSKVCLAQMWKHAIVPYKGLCKNLRLLAESTLLSNRPDPRDGSTFAQACKLNGGDERIASRCGNRYEKT